MKTFLVTTAEEMKARGWDELDFILVSGDAYVDHPSFAPAVIGRVLENEGYRVGIIPQPDWHTPDDFHRLGTPRLGALVTAGNLDSMLNKFTAAKKIRRQDSYSPGGVGGLRPDRATLVYANRVKEAFPKVPLIIGGIEASLRRFAHYDYWSDTVRRSLLQDSKADVLIYGMGERQIVALAKSLEKDTFAEDISSIRGICYMTRDISALEAVVTPSFEDIKESKKKFAEAFKLQYEEQDPYYGKIVVQGHGDRFVVQNPPAMPLTMAEMDAVYALPYARTWHPMYDDLGGVPAIEEVRFSLVSHRGCFGNCSFCAIASHQGRIIQERSHESLVEEAINMTHMEEFKGYIHDVGGPTANFRHASCAKQKKVGTCKGKNCAAPTPCPQLDTDHEDYLTLLRKIRKLPKIKKVFVRSGLRYDYLLADHNKEFVKELCEHHVSGQLKVAPEHISKHVTDMMGKAGKDAFITFKQWFVEANKELGKKQFLVPYFMSSHPGCTLKDAVELAEFLRDEGMQPEQVQDFIPTPGSLSTVMYYSGYHPLTGERVFTAKKGHEKALQRALLQYKNPANYELVYEALQKTGRHDLIGFGPTCLIRPRHTQHSQKRQQGNHRQSATMKRRSKW